jgi:hypothetical protein
VVEIGNSFAVTQRLMPASEGFEGFVWIAIPSKGLELASRSSKKWLMPARGHGRGSTPLTNSGAAASPFDFVSVKQTLKRKENYTTQSEWVVFFRKITLPLLSPAHSGLFRTSRVGKPRLYDQQI